jgi:hypothetical protein
MSNDPLARSDFWAGAPNDTEYDAIYAAVTATERGRWFLTEYANRNRNADTDRVVAAIARVESAICAGSDPQSSTLPSGELAELAAAIERIRASIGADKATAPAVGAAAERISDIAFGLRERAADETLCDALDAAVREITDACGAKVANGHSADTIELLRNLAARLDELIKLSAKSPAVHAAGDGTVPIAQHSPVAPVASAPQLEAETREENRRDDDALSQPGLFEMDLQENKKFAEAVAALAASLADADEAVENPEPQTAPTDTIMPLHDYSSVAVAKPPTVQTADPVPRWRIEAPDFVFASREPAATNGHAEPAPPPEEVHPPLSGSQLHPGPEEDPAELFEPAPWAVDAVSPAATLAPASSQPAEVPVEPLRIANGPVVGLALRASAADPLAVIRALSDEERIALFG